MRPRGGLLAALALAGCVRSARAPEETPERARGEFAHCLEDRFSQTPAAPELEAALRTQLRRDRRAAALRLGRCVEALTPALRERDARTRALGAAVDELLPLLQRAESDPIALDRGVRHLGDAWAPPPSPRADAAR